MNRDIIFIDTSIFIEEDYFVPLNRISTLKNLVSEGLISIVSTEITNREIKRRFLGEVTTSLNNIKNHQKVLKCFDKTNVLSSRDFKKQLLKDAEKKFDDFLKGAQVFTLGYDQCKDVALVFEKYFKREKPFAEGKKEKEFPDAFALQMLETYCKKNKLKIRVLSADSDMMEYKSDYLIPTDYKSYLTEKVAEAETLEKIRKAIDSNKDRICKDIEEYVSQDLDDERNYHGLFNTEEISDIEVKSCTVEMEDDFSIVSKEKDAYVIELHMNCMCEVRCSYISLDYATYDREDGKWYGGEWESETVEGESYFDIRVHFSDDGGDYLDLEMFELGDAVPSFKHSWDR